MSVLRGSAPGDAKAVRRLRLGRRAGRAPRGRQRQGASWKARVVRVLRRPRRLSPRAIPRAGQAGACPERLRCPCPLAEHGPLRGAQAAPGVHRQPPGSRVPGRLDERPRASLPPARPHRREAGGGGHRSGRSGGPPRAPPRGRRRSLSSPPDRGLGRRQGVAPRGAPRPEAPLPGRPDPSRDCDGDKAAHRPRALGAPPRRLHRP